MCKIAQMVERQTVKPEALGLNPATIKNFRTILQGALSNNGELNHYAVAIAQMVHTML